MSPELWEACQDLLRGRMCPGAALLEGEVDRHEQAKQATRDLTLVQEYGAPLRQWH